MNKLALLLLALATLASCKGSPTGTTPPTTRGTLTVVVSTSGGAPVAAAVVRLDPGARTAQTNAQGAAQFSDLAAGQYTASVETPSGVAGGTLSFRPPDGELRLTLTPQTIRILQDALQTLWGAPDSLTATVQPAGAGEIVWVSTADVHLREPVVLGRGTAVSTAPLRPGSTVVEARLMVGGRTVATDRVTVTVTYREQWNVDMLGLVPFPNNNSVGNVWVQGRLALVGRRAAGGFSVVDLDRIAEIGRYTEPTMASGDLHVANNIVYVTHEPFIGSTHPFAVTFVDITNPSAPRRLGGVPVNQIATAHTTRIDGTTLYIANTNTRQFHIWDVSDFAAPREISRVASVSGFAHDMFIRNGIFYGASMALAFGAQAEITIASVANPSAPAVLSRVPSTGPVLTHSAWTTPDGRYLYVADENLNAPIRILDVANPSAPVLVGTYQPRLGTVPHHFQVRDSNIAFLADYKNGVEVIDISNPTRPRLVGFWDTHPGIAADNETTTNLYQGAWGVHWTNDGRFVVSDMNRGLFVFRFRG